MKHIHSRDYYEEGDVIVLSCDTQCNFMIMTDSNYSSYRRGSSYKYHNGGFFKRFPASLAVPSTGHWNVVIDLGGGSANIRYGLKVIKGR